MPLLLACPAIPPGGEIRSRCTCDGAGISPALTWSRLQDGIKSLVLVVEDWGAFDIPAGSRGLDTGYSANRPAGGFHEARNDLGKLGYGGPCPPKEHGIHHYHFRLLAISQPTLDLKPTATAADVLRTAQPYASQRAELSAPITGDRRYHGPC
jgi:Raf kinase inhibitor-like YbhB/YbcL family protein